MKSFIILIVPFNVIFFLVKIHDSLVIVFYFDIMFVSRLFLRETLREMISFVPSLMGWIVSHSIQELGSFIDRVQQLSAAASSPSVPWTIPEILLHCLSALTKFIIVRSSYSSSVTDGDQGDRSEEGRLLALLGCEEVLLCRPLARMAVILVAELTPKVMAVCPSILSESSAHCSENLFRHSLKSLLFCALLHTEEATARSPRPNPNPVDNCSGFKREILIQQGSYLPFRLKQDHNAAVGISKLLSSGCLAALLEAWPQGPTLSAAAEERLILAVDKLLLRLRRTGVTAIASEGAMDELRDELLVEDSFDWTQCLSVFCLFYMTTGLQTKK